MDLDANLTPAEAAYALLASFQRGDQVDVTGPGFTRSGTVTTPQRLTAGDGDWTHLAYLVVATSEGDLPVSVADLLHRNRTIGARRPAAVR